MKSPLRLELLIRLCALACSSLTAVVVAPAQSNIQIDSTEAYLAWKQKREDRYPIDGTCFAGDPTITDDKIWVLHLVFRSEFNGDDVTVVSDKNNYGVYYAPPDSTKRRKIPILGACLSQASSNIVMLNLGADGLGEKGRYIVHVYQATYLGKPVDAPLISILTEKNVYSDPTQSPQSHTTVVLAKSDNREQSNFYLTGEATRASGEEFVWKTDLKLGYSFPKDRWGYSHYVTPFFELKASNAPKADPDSANFGLKWDWALPRFLGGSQWTNVGKIESNTEFTNTNLLWESRLTVVVDAPTALDNERVRMLFDPFFGHELGGNVLSPVDGAEGRPVSRLLVGANLGFVFPVDRPALSDITFESSYIRRWPLEREHAFTQDTNKKPVPLEFGRRPKDYTEVKLTFGFTKYFGAFIGYEYGRLPPTYKLVDHNLKIGFSYRAVVGKK